MEMSIEVNLTQRELKVLSEKISLVEGIPCKCYFEETSTQSSRTWNLEMYLIEDQFLFVTSALAALGYKATASHKKSNYLCAMAPYKKSKLDAKSTELVSDWVLVLEYRLRLAKEEVFKQERKLKEEREAMRLKKEMAREEKEKGRLAAERARLERRQQEDSNVDSNLRRRCREGNEAFIAGHWSRLNFKLREACVYQNG